MKELKMESNRISNEYPGPRVCSNEDCSLFEDGYCGVENPPCE